MASSLYTMITDADLLAAPILVVDDHAMNVRLLELTLRREGYTDVVCTTDPVAVGRLYQELQPALVLLDLHMPARGGFEILAELGQLTPGRTLPILVLTSDVTTQAHRRALTAGARAVLVKPFDRLDLLESVRTLLQVSLRERLTATDPARHPAAPAPRAGETMG